MSDHEGSQDKFVDHGEGMEFVEDAPVLAGSDDESDAEAVAGPEGSLDDQDMAEIDLEQAMENNSYSYFPVHEDSVYLIAAHPKLPLVVSGGGDDKAYIWTTHSQPPKLATELSGQRESVVAGGFTADGAYVVTGDMSGQIRVWKSKAGGEKWEFYTSVSEVDEIVWIKFHPKFPIIAVGAQDGSVWVYELGPKFSTIAVLTGHSQATTSGLFVNVDNEEQLSIVTISEDAQIICWDAYQSRAVYTLGPSELKGVHPWVSITGSPSGNTFAVGSLDGTLVVIKTDTGALLQLIQTADDTLDDESKSVEGLAWSDKTNLVAIGNVAGEVKLFHVANWRVRNTFKLPDAITKLEFAPGTPLLFASAMDGSIVAWNALSGELAWQGKAHNAGILGFAALENYKTIVTAGDEAVSFVFKLSLQE